MKANLKTISKAAMLVLLLLLMYVCLNAVFMGKSYNQHMSQIVLAPDNTYDVILAGPSHMQFAVQPAQLFGEQGIASCNISTTAQSIPTTYHLLKEMISRHDPDLVVVDLFCLYYPEKLFDPVRLHQAYDFFPLSENKIEAVQDLVSENHREFYLPFIYYHHRWKELSREDYVMYLHTNETFQLLDGLYAFDDPFAPVPEDQTAEIPEIPLRYLKQIVDLCRETDTQLLLTVIPYRADQDNNDTSAVYQQQIFNAAAQLAREWGVPYLNGLHYLEEMGFDFTTDMVEYSHVNTSGSAKISGFYGNYLRNNFDIPNRSQDPDYAHWYHDYDAYLSAVQERLG